jgi:hypothetical protein
VRTGTLLTPRPAPERVLPAAAGSALVILALPVFLLAGWPLAGWALGAVLWFGGQALVALLRRLASKPGTLAAASVQAFGMMFRALAVMVTLIAAVASDAGLALGAAGVYALAYTLELGLSLAAYYGATR